MGLSKSLNAFVNWRKVLSLLQVTTDTHALPARSLCPVCNSHQLLIFPDNALDGQWHSCDACGSKGDMIQLASKCWGLSIPTTIKKLVAAGVSIPDERTTENYIRYYETNHVDLPITIEAAMNDSFGKIHLQGLVSILKQYGWRIEGSSEWRRKGASKLVAGMHYSDIEAMLWPGTYKSGGMTPGKYVNNPSKSRIFTGRNWGDVLVLPHYDVPGRICALKIIGRKAEPDSDVLFKNVLWHQPRTEAGLSAHPSVLTGEGDTVFGFRDHAAAVRLQMRHMGMNPHPLQIVLWHSDSVHSSRACWNMLGKRQVVICDEKITPASLLQAMHVDGRMATTADMDYGQPVKTLERLGDRSLHWATAFDEFAEEATDVELEEILYQLPAVAVKKILDKTGVNTRERIKAFTKFRTAGRTVRIGSRIIEEREDCWYWSHEKKHRYMDHASESLVSDAVLRVDRVIYIPRSEKAYYQGRVKYQGDVMPFCEDRKKVDKKPFAWMQNFLLAQGKGMLRYSTWWEKFGVELTLLFKNPVFVQGCDIVGWDDSSGTFQLPHYVVTEAGVKKKEYETVSVATPAANIQSFKELTPEEMDRVTEPSRDNIAFWASWCACVSNILAPAFGHPTRGIGVVGDMGIQGMRQASRALGCISSDLPNRSESYIIRGKSGVENDHEWPRVVGLVGGSTKYPGWDRIRTMHWINSMDSHKDVVVVTIDQALGMLIAGGWHAVVDVTPFVGGVVDKVKDRLILNYLNHIMQNKLINVYQGGELLDNVFDSVAAWIEGYHSGVSVIEKGRELISGCDRSKTIAAFGKLLSRWYNAGLFEISGKVDSEKLAWKLKDGVFVSKPKVLQLWEKRRLPRLDVAALTEQLISDDVLVKEVDLNDCLGWVLDNSWWNKNVQQGATPSLRVYEG
jgi:hypothetical protein